MLPVQITKRRYCDLGSIIFHVALILRGDGLENFSGKILWYLFPAEFTLNRLYGITNAMEVCAEMNWSVADYTREMIRDMKIDISGLTSLGRNIRPMPLRSSYTRSLQTNLHVYRSVYIYCIYTGGKFENTDKNVYVECLEKNMVTTEQATTVCMCIINAFSLLDYNALQF